MPEPRWLYIGRIASPFGVEGEVRVVLDTEFPERLAERPLYLGAERRKVAVTSARLQRGEALMKLEGVDGAEAAERLRGQELFIATADATPLPAGRYYIHQLIGLSVVTDDGASYGEVHDVLSRPANDVFVVRHNGKEVLVPAIADVVKEIDLNGRRIVIDVIPGLE